MHFVEALARRETMANRNKKQKKKKTIGNGYWRRCTKSRVIICRPIRLTSDKDTLQLVDYCSDCFYFYYYCIYSFGWNCNRHWTAIMGKRNRTIPYANRTVARPTAIVLLVLDRWRPWWPEIVVGRRRVSLSHTLSHGTVQGISRNPLRALNKTSCPIVVLFFVCFQ